MDLETRLKFLIKKRRKELENKMMIIRLKAFKALTEKYCDERTFLCDVGSKVDNVYQKINGICNDMLNITLTPIDRYEAVIAAILINMFAEKKVIDELVSSMKKHCIFAYANINLLEIVFSNTLTPNFSSAGMPNSENILKILQDEVVKINTIIPHISTMCFKFLVTLTNTFDKIKIVLEHYELHRLT